MSRQELASDHRVACLEDANAVIRFLRLEVGEGVSEAANSVSRGGLSGFVFGLYFGHCRFANVRIADLKETPNRSEIGGVDQHATNQAGPIEIHFNLRVGQ